MSDDFAHSHLPYLFSSAPYRLAYTLPLLLLSLLLTFSGTFLTLDRSRSFPPRTDYTALPGAFDQPRRRRFSWYLEGGLGGLSCGYVTGLHLATFLSLLIPSKTSSAQLSPMSFLVVWVLSCISTTLLAGRFRYASLIMSGLSGGILTSLALSVIVHPSLIPRIVLAAVVSPLLIVSILVSYSIPKLHARLLHPTLRFCTSSIGAFGTVLSISLLSNPQIDGWANAWDRFLLHDGDNWGTGKEKGLSAAYGIFFVIGMASDWALRRWVGECPDEKWDGYLSSYTANMPNRPDRAGIFEPSKPFWERIFSSKHARDDAVLFPTDSDVKFPLDHTTNPGDPPVSDFRIDFAHKNLRTKSRKHRLKFPDPSCAKKRKPVKFGALDELSSSSDDEDEKTSSPLTDIPPPLSYTSSSPTLVDEPPRALHRKQFATANGKSTTPDVLSPFAIDYDTELAALKKRHNLNLNIDGVPDYSDHEEDTLMRPPSISRRKNIRRQSTAVLGPQGFMPRSMTSDPSSIDMNLSTSSSMPVSMTVPSTDSHTAGIRMVVPVPATPSLIKTLGQNVVARREAMRQGNSLPALNMGDAGINPQEVLVQTPLEVHGAREGNLEIEGKKDGKFMEMVCVRQERVPKWEEFWHEVRVKARS